MVEIVITNMELEYSLLKRLRHKKAVLLERLFLFI